MSQIIDFKQIDLTKSYTYTDYLTWKFNEKDLHEKYNLYQESGIREYWIIDPLAETVQVNTLELNNQYRQAD